MTCADLACFPFLLAVLAVGQLPGFSGTRRPAPSDLRREWAGAVAGGGGDMEPAAAWGRRAARAASAGRLDPVKKLFDSSSLWPLRPVRGGLFRRHICATSRSEMHSQNDPAQTEPTRMPVR